LIVLPKTTEAYELFVAGVVPLLDCQDVVKTAVAGLEGFFHRVQAIHNFHEG
jgi:hypothetical protein